MITAETTGIDLLDRISEDEKSCIREQVGDSVMEALASTRLQQGANDPAVAELMATCLETDNFLMLIVAVLSASAGESNTDSINCLASRAREYPDLVYASFGSGEVQSSAIDPHVAREAAQEVYECFSTTVKINLQSQLFEYMQANSPLSGQELFELMSEDDVQCLSDAVGVTAEQVELAMSQFQTLAEAIAGQEAAGAPSECLSASTLGDILVAIISSVIGGLSDESRSCMSDFMDSNPDYVNAGSFGYDPSMMTEEEFLDISDQGVEEINRCFDENEFLRIQSLLVNMLT